MDKNTFIAVSSSLKSLQSKLIASSSFLFLFLEVFYASKKFLEKFFLFWVPPLTIQWEEGKKKIGQDWFLPLSYPFFFLHCSMVVCGFLFLPLRKDEELVLSSNVLFFSFFRTEKFPLLNRLPPSSYVKGYFFFLEICVRSIPSFLLLLALLIPKMRVPFFQKTCSQVFPLLFTGRISILVYLNCRSN